MSATKKKRALQLGPLLEAAIKKKRLALPETEDEIAALEAQFKREGSIAYPARLSVVPDFGSSAAPQLRLRKRPVVDAAAAEEMARAARATVRRSSSRPRSVAEVGYGEKGAYMSAVGMSVKTQVQLLREDGHEKRNAKAKVILYRLGRVATMLYDHTDRADIARSLGVRRDWVLKAARFLEYPDGERGRK